MMKITRRMITLVAILLTSLTLASCSGNVGIGMSIGVPIGNHGYMSVGGSRWL
jgi:predicted small secreted protein